MTTSLGQRARPILGIVLVSFLASSCSKQGPALYPVHGQVFFEGQPLRQALGIFHPLDPDANPVKPRAVVGEDGTFKVFTNVADDGAPAGDYVVTVMWKKKRSTAKAKTEKEKLQVTKGAFPEFYQNPLTSGLRAQVQEG